jgi:hypothetical protein
VVHVTCIPSCIDEKRRKRRSEKTIKKQEKKQIEDETKREEISGQCSSIGLISWKL